MSEMLQFGKELVKVTSSVINPFRKNSIARMNENLIFQFPLMMSKDVPIDEIHPIAKSIEKNEAAMVQSAVMIDGLVDRDAHRSMLSYISQYHKNDETYSGVAKDIVSAIAFEGTMTLEAREALWAVMEEETDTSKLNDIYKPFGRTMLALESIHGAMEAARYGSKEEAASARDYLRGKGEYVNSGNNNPYKKPEHIKSPVAVNPEGASSSFGNSKGSKEEKVTARGNTKSLLDRTSTRSEMVKEEKYSALQPTMLKMSLTNVKEGVGSWNQEIVIGVKASIRRYSSSAMMANVIAAFNDRPIFTFIKWTKGELSIADILFRVSASREYAKLKDVNKDMQRLRRLSRIGKLTRFIGNRVLPNTTIIITDMEADEIKRSSGIDVRNVKDVGRMMDKYYLLAFGVYNTENQMLEIIYENESKYTTHSLRSLIADTKRELDLNSRR